MSEPFIGEIKMVSFNFAPKGWALCNGQLLPINQNQALFSLFGTSYGGDGRTTFALPDLRARVPVHMGPGFVLGQSGGSASVTLSMQQMVEHTHFLQGSESNGSLSDPTGALLGRVNNLYTSPANLTGLRPASVSTIGGSQAHENRQPFLVLSFCVALQGIYPSRN